jgi:uncharacterized protein involved in exopolysaccharide biosynthesis
MTTHFDSSGVRHAAAAKNQPAAAWDGDQALSDPYGVLAKHKSVFLSLPLVAALLAAVYSLLVTPIYTAQTRILPPQSGQSTIASMMAGQAVIGATGASGLAALGLKNPADLYVGILQGNSISDAIIERFELRKKYHADFIEDARLGLEKRSRITATRESIITIEVDDPDPGTAARMANAFVEELQRLTQRVAITEAGQRRLFFEKRLEEAKNGLAQAETAMQKTQERTGVLKLDDQGKAIIELISGLRAELARKEVEVSSLQTFATADNPDYIRAQRQLDQLREQLRRMEKSGATRGSGVFVPTAKLPEAGVEYLRALREVKYAETMFDVLAKQYELAKLDEGRESSLVQIIDPALPPERRSWPRRTLMVIVAVMLGVLLALGYIFASEFIKRFRRNGTERQRSLALRLLLRQRRPSDTE